MYSITSQVELFCNVKWKERLRWGWRQLQHREVIGSQGQSSESLPGIDIYTNQLFTWAKKNMKGISLPHRLSKWQSANISDHSENCHLLNAPKQAGRPMLHYISLHERSVTEVI